MSVVYLVQRHCQVVGNLSPNANDDASGHLPLVDIQYPFKRQLLEVQPIRLVVVGANLTRSEEWRKTDNQAQNISTWTVPKVCLILLPLVESLGPKVCDGPPLPNHFYNSTRHLLLYRYNLLNHQFYMKLTVLKAVIPVATDT